MPRSIGKLRLVMALVLATAAPALQARDAASPAARPEPDAAANGEVYRLGPGDKLRITVFNVEAITGEYTISSGGQVAVPLLGAVRAEGATTQQLADAIRTGLDGTYVKDPRITVEVLSYRPFYILGEVNQPGEFAYKPNLTLEQAVATAGGYTYRAARKKAYLRRAGEDEQVVRFGRESRVIYVHPGDTIRIGERYL
ncbi:MULTISPECIES: polysaccharide biosynthesis/export family protein [Novosphingobium]|uniref:Polysaccharide export protein n=1 Tax=Novosphingobium decolorationis TaxID=2698673 RepID=A0ABX8E6C6_9SPHN|nr:MULTISPECIES: polysaccharide biosynthesis/export family protein [Novosphingobium]QVM84569.1 polysaccharide export protein [Novosphingobium decolorationis]